MFRRYSLFDNSAPRLSVLPNNSNTNNNTSNKQNSRKNSLGQVIVPEIRVSQVAGPPSSKQITALQQRKSRSLSNSPVYRKKKYENLPTLIDHYYDYSEEDLAAIEKQDQEKQSLLRNSIIKENNLAEGEAQAVDNDKTDGLRHSQHVSRSRESNNKIPSKTRRNLHSFGNSIGLTRHRKLLTNDDHTNSLTNTSSLANDSVAATTSVINGIGGHSLAKDTNNFHNSSGKPLQPLVFNTINSNTQKQQQQQKERRASSPVHSCLLVRRRSDFSDPSFANLPPLLNSLKVSFFFLFLLFLVIIFSFLLIVRLCIGFFVVNTKKKTKQNKYKKAITKTKIKTKVYLT